MKRLVSLIAFFLYAVTVFSQAPQKMSYQVVIRNSNNTLIISSAVGVQVSILKGSVNGPEVYKEIYIPNPQTNANGLVTLEIGSGTPVTGSFATIDWSAGPYFIKTEIDPLAGTNYTITGTSQLLSVPYALYSETAGSIRGDITETDPVFVNHPSNSITSVNIRDWNSAYRWGNHAGLYSLLEHTHPYLSLGGGEMTNVNVVTNLNADLLDGHHSSFYAPSSGSANYIQNQNIFEQEGNIRITGEIRSSQIIFSTANKPTAGARIRTFDGLNGNDAFQFGYNLSNTLYVPNINSEPQMWLGFESNYPNNPERDPAFGNNPSSEMYLRYSQIGNSLPGGYLEPLFFNFDRIKNKIIRADLRGEHITLGNTPDVSYVNYFEITPKAANFNLPVGINLSSAIPTEQLEVNGNILIDGAGTILKTSDVSSYYMMASTPDGNFGVRYGNDTGERSIQFWTSNNERLRIKGDGNIGIGYTSGTEISKYKLAVNGSGYFKDDVNTVSIKLSGIPALLNHTKSGSLGLTGTILVSTGPSTEPQWKSLSEAGIASTSIDPSSGLNPGSIPLKSSTGLIDSPIYSNGTSVGIGTTTMKEIFEVAGNLKTFTPTTSKHVILSTGDGSIGRSVIQVLRNNGTELGWDLGTNVFRDGNDNFTLREIGGSGDSMSRLMIQKGTGYIGIGTLSPLLPLMVVGGSGNGVPPNSGTIPKGLVRLKSSSNSVLDFGTDSENLFESWIQASNGLDLSIHYPLALNPNGGNVGIGYLYSTEIQNYKLAVNGNIFANGTITTIGGKSTDWNTAYSWGNHAGLYRLISYVPDWGEITSNPFAFSSLTDGQLLKYNSATAKWENWTPTSSSNLIETDPNFSAWNKTSGIQIITSQISDFQIGVTNNAEMLANTAKNSYPTADATKLAGISEGAEVNVNADWNATSGDAQILNKPTISVGTNPGDMQYWDGAQWTIIPAGHPGQFLKFSKANKPEWATVAPTLTTIAVSSITTNSAISGGNIIDDGGGIITARGVCWSTSHNPTISDNKTNDGTETGLFTSFVAGLTAGNTYYLRAYATNSEYTEYGNEVSFSTTF